MKVYVNMSQSATNQEEENTKKTLLFLGYFIEREPAMYKKQK